MRQTVLTVGSVVAHTARAPEAGRTVARVDVSVQRTALRLVQLLNVVRHNVSARAAILTRIRLRTCENNCNILVQNCTVYKYRCIYLLMYIVYRYVY